MAKVCSAFVSDADYHTSFTSSVDNAKKSTRSAWTIPSVKAKIAELKMEHRQQIAKAIYYQLHEDRQIRLEETQTFDDLAWGEDGVEMMKVSSATCEH
jgi:hypothetical protein